MSDLKTIILTLGISLSAFVSSQAQDRSIVDSLQTELSAAKEDTLMAEILIQLGNQYRYNHPDSAMNYFQEALELSEQLGSLSLQANCKRSIGVVIENKGMYDQALEKYFEALALFEEDENKQGIASCYNDIAIIHYMQNSFELCMEYLTSSFEIKKELGDKEGMSSYYTNMSALNNSLGRQEEALEFAELSIDIHRELVDREGVAIGYGNIGSIQYELRNYRDALENHLKSVEIYEEVDNKDGIAHSLSNVAGVYQTMADSLTLTENQRLDYLNQAVFYGLKCYELTEELDAVYVQNYVANTLHGAYKALGDYKSALDYAQAFINTRESLFNEEKTRAIEEMDTKYETEKKQQQIELQESQLVAKDATIRQQKTLRNALVAGFIAVVIIVLVLVQAFIQKKRSNRRIMEQNELISEANEELQQLNDEIHAQKEEIEAQRDHVFNQNMAITDSINYAQRIQSAMLPPDTYVSELLNESFILYKPRDIVSGDFYWIKQVNRYVVVVAADCTGHGVPGALMSMLGISYLTEIVQRREITQTEQVLNELRKQIKYSLRQHGGRDETKDGMDMALCAIDLKNNRLQYSGANNSLYLVRDLDGKPELEEIKADRMPVGYYQGKDSSFTQHDIALEPGDTIYLFSDGFIDQKGGEDSKRYMSKRFKTLLLSIQDLSMPEQKEKLDLTLSEWMGTHAQTDDVLVVGFRV